MSSIWSAVSPFAFSLPSQLSLPDLSSLLLLPASNPAFATYLISGLSLLLLLSLLVNLRQRRRQRTRQQLLTDAEHQLQQSRQQLDAESQQHRQSRQQLRLVLQVLDNLPLAVYVKQFDAAQPQSEGRYWLWNSMAQSYSGLSPNQVVGKTAAELWDAASSTLFSQTDQAAVQSIAGSAEGGPAAYFSPAERFGRHLRLLSIPLPARAEDQHRYLLGVMEDNTRQIDQQGELLQASQEDGLTRLYNRRYFDSQLASEWNRHLRRHATLGLLFIDVDYFKRFNDSAGHQAGDECLQRLASLLQEQIRRAGEFVARFGGEEFVVLLPNTELQGAIALARRLQRVVQQEALPHPDSPFGRLTLSMGVSAMIPVTENSHGQLLQVADQALYMAKEAGRNRLFSQDELPAQIG